MVGRLVEQQQLRLLHQRASHRHAPARAARERRHRGIRFEGERGERALDAALRTPAVVRFESLLRSVQRLEQCRLGTLREPGREPMVFDERSVERAQTGCDGFEHGQGIVECRLLLHERNPQTRSRTDLAVVGRELPREHAQKTRLPRSVATDETDPLAAFDHEIDMIEQRQVAVGERDFLESEKGHGCRHCDGASEHILGVRRSLTGTEYLAHRPWTRSSAPQRHHGFKRHRSTVSEISRITSITQSL